MRVASHKMHRDFIHYMLPFESFDSEVLISLLFLSGLSYSNELQTCVLKADSYLVCSQLDLLN